MLISNGDGLGVDGLTECTFVFDKNGRLVAVGMTLPKTINETVNILSKKYSLVANEVDNFMGYGSATFEKGGSVVLVNAEHLSFNQTVRYFDKDYYEFLVRTATRKVADDKKQQEAKY